MQESKVLQALLCLIFVSSPESRKYDIEEEAMKIYKEDLRTVLKRFRRSPEYLKILEEKVNQMREGIDDVQYTIMLGYADKLKTKVMETLGIKMTNGQEKGEEEEDGGCGRKGRGRKGYGLNILRVGQCEDTVEEVKTEEKDKDTHGIKKLDKYTKLHSPLTLEQRNAMRDLAFDMASRWIHDTIQTLEGDLEGQAELAHEFVQHGGRVITPRHEKSEESNYKHEQEHDLAVMHKRQRIKHIWRSGPTKPTTNVEIRVTTRATTKPMPTYDGQRQLLIGRKQGNQQIRGRTSTTEPSTLSISEPFASQEYDNKRFSEVENIEIHEQPTEPPPQEIHHEERILEERVKTTEAYEEDVKTMAAETPGEPIFRALEDYDDHNNVDDMNNLRLQWETPEPRDEFAKVNEENIFDLKKPNKYLYTKVTGKKFVDKLDPRADSNQVTEKKFVENIDPRKDFDEVTEKRYLDKIYPREEFNYATEKRDIEKIDHREEFEEATEKRFVKNIDHREEFNDATEKRDIEKIDHREEIEEPTEKRFVKKVDHREEFNYATEKKDIENIDHREEFEEVTEKRFDEKVDHREEFEEVNQKRFVEKVDHREEFEEVTEKRFVEKVDPREEFHDVTEKKVVEKMNPREGIDVVTEKTLVEKKDPREELFDVTEKKVVEMTDPRGEFDDVTEKKVVETTDPTEEFHEVTEKRFVEMAEIKDNFDQVQGNETGEPFIEVKEAKDQLTNYTKNRFIDRLPDYLLND